MTRPVKVDLTREEARLLIEQLRRYTGGEHLLAMDVEARIADALEASLVLSAGPGRQR